MKETILELPEGFEKETHSAENYQFVLVGSIGYLWAIHGVAEPGGQFTFIYDGIIGSLPVSACATEWDERNNQPVITDAIIEISSVQRTSGRVRVIVKNTSTTRRDIAVGLIFATELPIS